jgi:hypothetical protein
VSDNLTLAPKGCQTLRCFLGGTWRHGWMVTRPRDPKGLSVLPDTQNLARPRQKLPASAHMLTASQDSSFINHAPSSSL